MISEIKEVKSKDGKRCIQVTAEIMDEPSKVTEKGNGTVVSLGGNVKTDIKANNGNPLTVGLFGYAKYD